MKNVNRSIIIVFLVSFGIVATLLYLRFSTSPNLGQNEQVVTHVYQNTEHGYSLSFPTTLESEEYSQDYVVFGIMNGENVDGVADVQVMTLESETGKTLDGILSERLMSLCAADGPSSTFSCTEVESMQPFKSQSGVEGKVYYLTGELTDFETNEVTQHRKGPFFVFPQSSSATVSKVIVVHAPMSKYTEEVDTQTIQSIAESLKIN